ncbi:MAG: divalent metal cation transporter, partial [Bacteroidota bacterium]
VTFISMFIVTAAVTFVAAGLLSNLMGLAISIDIWAAVIFFFCVILLSTGKYNALDGLLKVVSTVLLISTVTAVMIAFINGRTPRVAGFLPKEVLSPEGVIFLIALMGWMPTAVDMSTWTGLWAEARMKQTGYRPTKKETLLDFNLGYGITALLAIVFLSLGALVLFGTGIELSNSSAAFAGQLIGMYTSSIGEWSYIIIAAAAFSTMFSTSITVLDGYGRSMERIQKLLGGKTQKWSYTVWIGLVTVGSYIVISQFLNDLKSLVDLATILSFVIAPLAAYLNYKVILSKEVTADFQPPHWLRLLAQAGMVFLILFTLIYFGVLIF